MKSRKNLNYYSNYINERKQLIVDEGSQAASFDKYLLTLSSGIFGLSLTFLKDIIISPIRCEIILFISWLSLALTIFSTLSSFLLSQFAYQKQREILEDLYFNNYNQKVNFYSLITQGLNIASIIFFTVGVVLLLIFVYINFFTGG